MFATPEAADDLLQKSDFRRRRLRIRSQRVTNIGSFQKRPVDALVSRPVRSAEQNGGNVMRYLKLIILFLAYALITPAFAQPCCPSGCVQDANRCVIIGTQNSCGASSCLPGSGSSPSGTHAPGSAVVYPRPLIGECGASNPTQAAVDDATNRCVNDLTGSAIFVGCFFEDDAGRAEDERTGLSCPARQAALAKQCRNRCAAFAFASTRPWCYDDPNSLWHNAFGDISGDVVGSARVERCGSRLRDSYFSRVLRTPTLKRLNP
jgi:hypothetical protein